MPELPEPVANKFLPNRHHFDTHEISPHEDRNQYLQTGHLSEEGAVNNSVGRSSNNTPNDANDSAVDNLPPPGLSRLVLGQPEGPSGSSHPPPGLDRMVPGTELTNSTHLNFERQADGQDEMTPPPLPARNSTPYTPTFQQQGDAQGVAIGEPNISDRNLYLVPGESDLPSSNPPTNTANFQRVVTGVENIPNQDTISPSEEQRELLADGENVDDDVAQNLPPPAVREEPIEGANTLDELPPAQLSQQTNHLTEADSIEALDVASNRKYNSNPSTGNDESDKEKPYYPNRRGSNSRRSEEKSRKRGEKDDNRYETEDTDYSVRDRRKYRDSRDKYDRGDERDRVRTKDKDASYRRGDREKYRGREEEGDFDQYRDKYGRRTDKDKYSRYETDGSRYETEDSRYDRSLRKRGDRDRDPNRSYRDDRSDGRYRKDRNGDREIRKDDRYRRDDRSEYESGDYGRVRGSQKDRKRGNGSERGDAYGQQYAYPSHSGYGNYDYSQYYQQQQYYENLRRTNPHAYAEWYKQWYGSQMQQTVADDRGRESGRESVHSGRSSTKDQDRYVSALLELMILLCAECCDVTVMCVCLCLFSFMFSIPLLPI